jgi:hypothetical protein
MTGQIVPNRHILPNVILSFDCNGIYAMSAAFAASDNGKLTACRRFPLTILKTLEG